MNSYSSGRRSRHPRGGARRRGNSERFRGQHGEAKTKKRHSGSELRHFLETARAQSKQQRTRATVRSLHDRHESLNESKSLRRVFTSATCLSTPPRAISSNYSTAWGTCKMRRL